MVRFDLTGAKRQHILLSLCLVLFLILAFSSEALAKKPKKKQKALDTIVTVSGKRYPVRIRIVNHKKVTYYKPGSKKMRSMKRSRVNRVIYANGRIEKITEMAVRGISEDDYRIVILTDDESMVQGLYSKGVVKAVSRGRANSIHKARKSAENRLKKQAVRKGATYVLVKSRRQQGGYGEVPTYTIEGEAYGTEPDSPDSTKAKK